MKTTAIAFIILIVAICINSCGRHAQKDEKLTATAVDTVYIHSIETDTIWLHDTVTIENNEEIVTTWLCAPPSPMLDSIRTRKVMEKSMCFGYFDIPYSHKERCQYDMYESSDMEYLPYFMNVFSSEPTFDYLDLLEYFISMCTMAVDDKDLFAYGKKCVDKINIQISNLPPYQSPYNGKIFFHRQKKYPNEFEPGLTDNFDHSIPYKPTALDTLRIGALIRNDRNALAQIEDYYRGKGDEKGLAIYYKVMLNYDGNGDLAERFYRVLAPHINEMPELRIAVRKVLLRAALCDRDKRAQELCDSLGFSLCDYKIDVPCK